MFEKTKQHSYRIAQVAIVVILDFGGSLERTQDINTIEDIYTKLARVIKLNQDGLQL